MKDQVDRESFKGVSLQDIGVVVMWAIRED